MRRGFLALVAVGLLVLAACGGNGDGVTGSQPVDSATTAVAPSDTVAPTETLAPNNTVAPTQPVDGVLPAACVLAPFTVTAQRVGSSPIGSDAFEVTDAVVVPIPIVPNPDGALSGEETKTISATTDLLGYSLVFADEEITGGGSMFFQFDPSTTGKLRGLVSIFPAAGAPFVAGDVVVYGEASGLSIPLPTLAMDLAAFEQDTNTYRDEPTGQVAVLGLTNDAVCLDVDLTWKVNDPTDNVLTIQGVFTGRLLDRSTVVVLG